MFSSNQCNIFPDSGCNHMVFQLSPIRELDNKCNISCFYKNNKKSLCNEIRPVGITVIITIGIESTTSHFQSYAYEYHNFELGSNLTCIVQSDYPVQVTGFAMGSNTPKPYMTVFPSIYHFPDYYLIIVPENYRD